jgi:ABC-type transporter Mla subunit MlaD
MSKTETKRSGLVKYLGDVLESTKTFADDLNDSMNDMLDNSEKLQRSFRDSTKRVFRVERDEDEDEGASRPRLREADTPTRRTAPSSN